MDPVSCTRLTTAEVSALAHGAAGRTWPVFQSRSMLFNNSTRPAVSYQAQSSPASKLPSEPCDGASYKWGLASACLPKKRKNNNYTNSHSENNLDYLFKQNFFLPTSCFNFLEEPKIFVSFHTFSLKVVFLRIIFSVKDKEEEKKA